MRAYLDKAHAQLANSADRGEVLDDLEQSIAEKLTALLRPQKTVVSRAEIAQILQEIGPLQTAEGDTARAADTGASASAARPRPSVPRRLYRIRDGASLAGICNGLAAYNNQNVYLIRVLTVLATLMTGFLGAVVYFVLIFVIPVADTEEELAAATAPRFGR